MPHSVGIGKTKGDAFRAALGEDNLRGISIARNNAQLEYYGATTATTATELFFNGKGQVGTLVESAERCYIPPGGAAGFDVRFVAVNVVTQAIVCAGGGFVGVQRAVAGNVTLSPSASGTPLAGNSNSTNPSFVYNVGNTAAQNINFTVDVATQTLRCIVTAPSAQRTIWKVALVPAFSCTDRTASRFFGDSGLGDALES